MGTLCNEQFVEMYALYTSKYENILNIFGKEKKNKKSQKYLRQMRAQKKPLTNHLILPIQRCTRYLLLMSTLKEKTPSHHSEYDHLEQVLIKINEMVTSINTKQREIENLSQCLQIQESINGLDRNIVEKDRNFIAQFLFRKRDNQRGRQFFVFNDIVIVTNIKLKCKALMEMKTIDIKKRDDNKLIFHVISLNHSAEYETDLEKIEDLDKIIKLVEDNRNNQYRATLNDVGANGLSVLLKTQSFNQGDIYREQVLKKRSSESQSNLQSEANALLATTSLSPKSK